MARRFEFKTAPWRLVISETWIVRRYTGPLQGQPLCNPGTQDVMNMQNTVDLEVARHEQTGDLVGVHEA